MIDPITKAVRDALPAPLLSQAQCRRVAVAVLRAVREPSEGMAWLGDEEAQTCVKDDPCGAAGAHVWGTMIDTLISELEKEPAE